MPVSKSPFLSKTLWASLVLAMLGFIPSVQTWVSANPQPFAEALAGIFFVLRLVSHGKIDVG